MKAGKARGVIRSFYDLIPLSLFLVHFCFALLCLAVVIIINIATRGISYGAGAVGYWLHFTINIRVQPFTHRRAVEAKFVVKS